MSKVLVVAFDGMDKELIENFDLENIPQKEFGSIDNSTEVSRRMTSELFASFITGETFEKHGIEGLDENPQLRHKWNSLVDFFVPDYALRNIRGVQTLKDTVTFSDKFECLKYTKENLERKTLFEEIDASLPLYVPSYNPEIFWLLRYPHESTKYLGEEGYVEECRYDSELRLNYGRASQPAFFDVTKDFWDFIMLHLHDPDALQDTGLGDIEEEYQRLDDIAGEILEEYEGWTVIFMSDHGKPEEGGIGVWEHNKNAFYSCNVELFDDETPHITDFYDKILSLVSDN